MLRGSSRWPGRALLAAALPVLLACATAGPARASGTTDALEDGLAGLVDQLDRPSLTAAQRARVHAAKREIVVAAYADAIHEVAADRVLNDLDCISLNLQRARDAAKAKAARSRIADARACRDDLVALAKDRGAQGLASDLAVVGTRLKAIAAAAAKGRAFGTPATALRKLQAQIVSRRFAGSTLHGVPVAEVYESLECIDVKVESRRVSGAEACARKLLRRTGQLAPPKPTITFGSDLVGTPITLPVAFPAADTEFWTTAMTVPEAGTITAFRVRTGDSPVDLPLRFSVVRPRSDGKLVVVTTTTPTYPLVAHDAGVQTYATSALSFACCKVQRGDIVTIDNSGTLTAGAYVFFAAKEGVTTFSHTGYGDSQNAGNVWEGTPHAGYDVLVQVVLQPD